MLVEGTVLALAAVADVAWAAGFANVTHQLRNPHLIWLPLARAGSVVAHAGYLLPYREVARPEEGPRLGFPRAGALVATRFGMLAARGGFALDLEALRDLGARRASACSARGGAGSRSPAWAPTGSARSPRSGRA